MDHHSDRQHCKTVRPLPLIDTYNPYYPDPDFGFDPYWDTQIYNQHHLFSYNNFTKNTTDTEAGLPVIDLNLKTTLSKALVDPWQQTRVAQYPTTLDEPTKELPQVGLLVTLIATVEERFVNTVISRN